ncbi:MAG: DUF4383 domain-containing protein [Pseudonocardia sp.]|nr:DUF4383 domain-containing protein [Pseudonocardia sp.]
MTIRENTPEVKWGVQSTTGVGSAAKKFALIAGLIYVVGGLIGFFFTGFSNFTEATGTSLFGIFHLTPFHNIVHIGVGAVWLLAAFVLTRPAAEGVNLGIGGVYVLAAILGYFGSLTFLGVMPGLDPDFFLHLVTGVLSLIFAGLIPIGRNT